MTEPTHDQRRHAAIDEFESMFKQAEREPYGYEQVSIGSILLVTDGPRDAAERLAAEVRSFLPRIDDRTRWTLLGAEDFSNVNELLDRVRDDAPDLIVTSRCLFERSLVPQHTLGVYVDVLTQVTTIPVLLLPGTAPRPHPLSDEPCREVLAVTDHIAGDDRLINAAARFTATGGTLWLCHVEDDVVLQRYLDAIARIPEINTDTARDHIGRQLLASAEHFVETCKSTLAKHDVGFRVESLVEFGHRLVRYRRLVDEQRVDLLVTNTKDVDQLAMHGLAYAIAVELTDVPQLLL